jgi:hypothetical protein
VNRQVQPVPIIHREEPGVYTEQSEVLGGVRASPRHLPVAGRATRLVVVIPIV